MVGQVAGDGPGHMGSRHRGPGQALGGVATAGRERGDHARARSDDVDVRAPVAVAGIAIVARGPATAGGGLATGLAVEVADGPDRDDLVVARGGDEPRAELLIWDADGPRPYAASAASGKKA